MSNDAPNTTVSRFMECEDGRQFLEGIRTHLKGHQIDEVTFKNNDEAITTVLHLSNGDTYTFDDYELFLATLREQFSGVFRELDRREKEERDE